MFIVILFVLLCLFVIFQILYKDGLMLSLFFVGLSSCHSTGCICLFVCSPVATSQGPSFSRVVSDVLCHGLYCCFCFKCSVVCL